jgi:hypothetical protein
MVPESYNGCFIAAPNGLLARRSRPFTPNFKAKEPWCSPNGNLTDKLFRDEF